MIKKELRDALFIEIHKAIEESAESVAQLQTSHLSYPPGVELTPEETAALQTLNLSAVARSALRRLAANACSYPLFQFFCLLDGVADPESEPDDVWLGATLAEKPDEDEPMLHDEFYESYWLWKED